jgi:hypothetical protein
VGKRPLAAQERRAILVERIQTQLTDEQEAKIAEIQKAARPKVEAAAKEPAAVARRSWTRPWLCSLRNKRKRLRR